jgi:hypothetical protein
VSLPRFGTAILLVYGAILFLPFHKIESQTTPELRVDGIFARQSAFQAGAGIMSYAGTYMRAGVAGGIGVSGGKVSARADLIADFHLDPFRETRWGPYVGGGMSFRHDCDRDRAYLLALIGWEGPLKRGLAPAIEAGFVGGARLGLIIRRGRERTR